MALFGRKKKTETEESLVAKNDSKKEKISKDKKSKDEFEISGICQECQDKYFESDDIELNTEFVNDK
jgi:hypothetical protein